MSTVTCNFCDVELSSKRSGTLKNHQNTSIRCLKIQGRDDAIKKIKEKYLCDKCNSGFKNQSHLNRHRETCLDPSNLIKPRKTLEDYKKLASERKGEYPLDCIPKNTHTPTKWKCEFSHIWETAFGCISSGNWCPFCAGVARRTLEDYKQIAHDMGGEYMLDYIPDNVNTSTALWKCKLDHTWSATFNSISSNGSWCPVCAGNARKTLEEYKQVAQDMGGEYILDYIPANNCTPINGWKCEIDHIFEATFTGISSKKNWCSKCRFRSEDCARTIISDQMSRPFLKIRPDWLDGLELDGYNEELNLAFEYQGQQHYEWVKFFHKEEQQFLDQQTRDKKKIEICKNRGVELILIPYEYSFKNPEKMKIFILDQLIATKNIMMITPSK